MERKSWDQSNLIHFHSHATLRPEPSPINGSTTACHVWLKLTIDPRSAGVFDYDRVLYRNQPGLDPSTCPSA